jgi:HEPN domain-containing protein
MPKLPITPLRAGEIDARLRQIDAELEAQAVPFRYRTLESFTRIYGDVADGPLRNALFDPISAWYFQRHGEQAIGDGILGRLPVLIRGAAYLLRVPLVDGDAVLRFIDQLEDVPSTLAQTFTPQEFEALAHQAALATPNLFALYNLHLDHADFRPEDWAMVWRAVSDLEIAPKAIRDQDTQNAIFHVQQAAEKFLKTALNRCQVPNTRRFQHRLPDIFEALRALKPRYEWLESSVLELQRLAPNMDIRYNIVPRRLEDAIRGFYAALNVCGKLAQMWIFDRRRGSTDSAFQPGSFYIDGTRSTFFCREMSDMPGHQAVVFLRRFGRQPATGGHFMADIGVSPEHSALYLEVQDRDQIEALRSTLTSCEAHCVHSFPGEVRTRIDSGPEGSGATAWIRISASGPIGRSDR